MNIVVVGFGLIGQRHCEIINNQKNINLSAIVENNLEKNFSRFASLIKEINIFVDILYGRLPNTLIGLLYLILFKYSNIRFKK